MSAIPKASLPPARRSVFAQAAATEAEAAETTAPIFAVPPQPARNEAAAPATRSKRPSGRNRDILLSVPEELKARMEATIAHTVAKTNIKHQQVFIRRAIELHCEQLEAQYNNGDQFELLSGE